MSKSKRETFDKMDHKLWIQWIRIKNSCGHKKDEYQMILVSDDDGHHCPNRRRCPEYNAAGTVICWWEWEGIKILFDDEGGCWREPKGKGPSIQRLTTIERTKDRRRKTAWHVEWNPMMSLSSIPIQYIFLSNTTLLPGLFEMQRCRERDKAI